MPKTLFNKERVIKRVDEKFMLQKFVKAANQATINAFRAGKKFIRGPKNGF